MSPSGSVGHPGPQVSIQAQHAGREVGPRQGCIRQAGLTIVSGRVLGVAPSGGSWEMGLCEESQNMGEQCLGSWGPFDELDGWRAERRR